MGFAEDIEKFDEALRRSIRAGRTWENTSFRPLNNFVVTEKIKGEETKFGPFIAADVDSQEHINYILALHMQLKDIGVPVSPAIYSISADSELNWKQQIATNLPKWLQSAYLQRRSIRTLHRPSIVVQKPSEKYGFFEQTKGERRKIFRNRMRTSYKRATDMGILPLREGTSLDFLCEKDGQETQEGLFFDTRYWVHARPEHIAEFEKIIKNYTLGQLEKRLKTPAFLEWQLDLIHQYMQEGKYSTIERTGRRKS